ncbi:hypothetical protein A3Q56_04595 [Intoshia linei]|uniref:Uncharacterized protein n=1 Tax=Intoshia linei TaxID=1819745 RepID=A0A177B051_9BILA|nr:hypothetical protein A3Q56_04595 [Intoshia linei]
MNIKFFTIFLVVCLAFLASAKKFRHGHKSRDLGDKSNITLEDELTIEENVEDLEEPLSDKDLEKFAEDDNNESKHDLNPEQVQKIFKALVNQHDNISNILKHLTMENAPEFFANLKNKKDDAKHLIKQLINAFLTKQDLEKVENADLMCQIFKNYDEYADFNQFIDDVKKSVMCFGHILHKLNGFAQNKNGKELEQLFPIFVASVFEQGRVLKELNKQHKKVSQGPKYHENQDDDNTDDNDDDNNNDNDNDNKDDNDDDNNNDNDNDNKDDNDDNNNNDNDNDNKDDNDDKNKNKNKDKRGRKNGRNGNKHGKRHL